MSAVTLPPPAPPVCLTRSYKSRGCKGGTVIAEGVRDHGTHRRMLVDPDEHRSVLGSCRACGSKTLHAHCLRERQLRGALNEPPAVETIRLYRCAQKTCGAVFTVLPTFICRHLWRRWSTVEGSTTVPSETRRRWRARLESSASQLVQALTAQACSLVPGGFFSAVATAVARSDLLEVFRLRLTRRLSAFTFLASWIHRLQPGIRLM